MKIAVTGGSGFIGRWLVTALRHAGHEVVIVDLVHDQPIDILHLDKLTTAFDGCDAVYHLAAAHRDDIFPRSIYYEVNGTGTENVVKAAKAKNIKHIIFTSTVAVYGLKTHAPDEQTPPAPFNDYGHSKLEAETHLKAWAAADAGCKATIVRPVVVFGETNRGNVFTLIKQIARGRFTNIGKGDNKKSMAYVGNISEFLMYCLNAPTGAEIYNYADKPDFTTNTLTGVIYNNLGLKRSKLSMPYWVGLCAGYVFDVLARVMGRTFPISSIRIKKFCADTTVTADKCREFGFKPKFTLAEGVARMIEYDFPKTKKEIREAA